MKLRLWSAVFVVELALLGCAPDTPSSSSLTRESNQDQSHSPPAGGHKVDIGERDLFLSCEGVGSPTIVLETGFGGDSGIWPEAGLLEPLQEVTRTCAYDRAGLGASDPAEPHTLDRSAEDLHTLLQLGNERPPFILVGHSLGGYIVRLYQASFPDEVSGLMLIDSPHESFTERASRLLPPRMEKLLGLPAENIEKLDLESSEAIVRAEAGADGVLGDLPLVVMTRGRPDHENPLSDVPGLERLWRTTQSELTDLSNRQRHVVAARSGHFIPQVQPALVVRWARWLVEVGD